MAAHDNAYKNLFSHPQVVRDLLRGFVAEPWVDELDFTSLEKASGSYVSDDLRDREDDIIWRIRHQEGVVYIYLLLEFQRSDDPWMALRIHTYVGLLYQDLVKRGEVKVGQPLPAVFPAVIHSGEQPWRSARDVADLVGSVPATLDRYRPRQRYFLLDEAVIADLPLENAVSDIIDLESRPAPEAFEAILDRLRQRLSGDENRELRRAFTVWIHRVILPSLVSNEALPPVEDLEDVAMVIRERGRNWFEQGELRGELRGEQRGEQRGLQKGAARTLLRQFELRFGKVPEDVRARIAEADLETLLRWSEQVLTAETIEDAVR